jgi:hypothetical protein
MQNILLWIAVVLSLITFYVHTFIGGPRVAAPLLMNKDLPKASKWLNYYCWHIATLYLFIMGGGYAYVALHPDRPELVVFLTVLNSSFAILSVMVALKGKISPFRFPSTTLFTLLSLVGLFWLVLK